MQSESEPLSPELIAAVKNIVESLGGVDFTEFLKSYKEINSDQPELSEEDLVAEILEAGEYQTDDESTFEDAVIIGTHILGEDLGLF